MLAARRVQRSRVLQMAIKYAGMQADDVRRLKDLEVENARLEKFLAEAHLALEALKVGFGVKR